MAESIAGYVLPQQFHMLYDACSAFVAVTEGEIRVRPYTYLKQTVQGLVTSAHM